MKVSWFWSYLCDQKHRSKGEWKLVGMLPFKGSDLSSLTCVWGCLLILVYIFSYFKNDTVIIHKSQVSTVIHWSCVIFLSL